MAVMLIRPKVWNLASNCNAVYKQGWGERRGRGEKGLRWGGGGRKVEEERKNALKNVGNKCNKYRIFIRMALRNGSFFFGLR